MPINARNFDVIVIGAGISGLVAAHSLLTRSDGQHGGKADSSQAGAQASLPAAEGSRRLTILEGSDRIGGVIATSTESGYVVEHGPDSFLTTKPWAIDLCEKLGLSDQIIGTNSKNRRAFVAYNDRLEPLPAGFMLIAPSQLWSFLDSPVLSMDGKLRAVWEMFSGPDSGPTDESLKSFIVRRFGLELYERIAQPMVAGIYTGDPSQLSARATMPQFIELQRKYGSVIRGLMLNEKRTEGGARYGAFATLRGGMADLTTRLTEKIGLERIRLKTRVRSLRRADGRWRLATDDGDEYSADAVIFAVPPHVVAQIVTGFDPALAQSLSRIESASSAIINLLFRKEQINHALDGFGFVVPEREQKSIIACSFSSVKFPGRAPKDKCLFRAFLGGALHPDIFALSDGDLLKVALRDLQTYLGLTAFPEEVWVKRWPGSMPQYKVGHLERVKEIKYAFAAHPGLIWSGNSLGGVGIPDCVKSGQDAATLVNHFFAAPLASGLLTVAV
jgi:oxygen-dependent protoporphyrinogen oxidase